MIHHNKYAYPITIPDFATLSHQKEEVKFVGEDETCEAERPVFMMQMDGRFHIKDNGEMPATGRLCFKFEDEDFYLFEEYTLTMVQLRGLIASRGADYRVVSGHPKSFALDCDNCVSSDAIFFTA